MTQKKYLPVLVTRMNGDVDRQTAVLPSKAHPLYISASQLRDFLRCRLKWYWRHQLEMVPVERAVNLAIGTLVHAAREQWYDLPTRGKTLPLVKRRTIAAMKAIIPHVFKELKADLTVLSTEDRQLVEAMLIGYAEWAKTQDPQIGLVDKAVSTEHWFELPLTKEADIIVRGKLDIMFEPADDKLTIATDECKTASQIRVNLVEMNLQCSVYLWAMRELHPKYKSYLAYRTTMRKQMPGPRVTADLFHRESIERAPEEIDLWARDARRMALDMVGAAIYPNATGECAWDCDYNTPCILRGNPGDFKEAMRRSFMKKPPREEKR
jgi:hypothetical protein